MKGSAKRAPKYRGSCPPSRKSGPNVLPPSFSPHPPHQRSLFARVLCAWVPWTHRTLIFALNRAARSAGGDGVRPPSARDGPVLATLCVFCAAVACSLLIFSWARTHAQLHALKARGSPNRSLSIPLEAPFQGLANAFRAARAVSSRRIGVKRVARMFYFYGVRCLVAQGAGGDRLHPNCLPLLGPRRAIFRPFRVTHLFCLSVLAQHDFNGGLFYVLSLQRTHALAL